MSQVVSPSSQNKKKLKLVLSFTSLYLLIEVIGGFRTGSLALLADAGHMVTDVAGLALSLFAIHMAERPASGSKTFGYYRTEILAALTNAVVLIGISLYILFEAYQRFLNPPQVATTAMSAIVFVGLLVNVAGILVLRSGSRESLNMKGAYFEVMSDLLTSIGVIIAGIIMWLTGWYYADPLISAAIGLLILPRTWILMKDAISVLLEGTPTGLDMAELRKSLSAIEGVKKVHDLHAWSLTTGVNAATAHVVRSENYPLNTVLINGHKLLKEKFSISHATIQVEDEGFEEKEMHL